MRLRATRRCLVELPIAGSRRTLELGSPKIIALGLNYEDHVRETGMETPSEPIIFAKTPNVLVPTGQPIVIPSFLSSLGFAEVTVHYEAELAVIIGRRCSRARASEAAGYVLGLTCFNDVSQRNIQFADQSGWFRGKSLDTFGPIGPRVVPLDMLNRWQDLEIKCRLNGKVVQHSRTGNLIFSIPEVIEWISSQITLEPGDIIATGTPAGVGPIAHGDIVEVEIGGIGILANPVIDESRLQG
jgi:2-keto-4-pentenoate hydratase/2-oxohepta-3-ene-1,7-dioic acid hydratase in catechol pathway